MVVSNSRTFQITTQKGLLEVKIKHKLISISHWYKSCYEDFPNFVQLNQVTIPILIINSLKSDIFGTEAQSVLDYLPHSFGDKICFAKIKDYFVLDDIHVRVGLKLPSATKSFIAIKVYKKINNEWLVINSLTLDAIQLYWIKRCLRKIDLA